MRPCLHCGGPLATARSNAKWCSDRCRKRGKRTAGALSAVPEPVRKDGAVTAATRAALAAAGRAESPLGAAAVALAVAIDNGDRETGSALAALSKQLEDTLAAATRANGAGAVRELQDELAARRARQGGWSK